MRLYALAFLLAGCNGTAPMGGAEEEPSPPSAQEPADAGVFASDAAPGPPRRPPPVIPDSPAPTTTTLLSPTRGDPLPPGAPALPGYHWVDGCGYDRDLIKQGECVCTKALCAAGCVKTASGAIGARAFCFDAGLPYDYAPK